MTIYKIERIVVVWWFVCLFVFFFFIFRPILRDSWNINNSFTQNIQKYHRVDRLFILDNKLLNAFYLIFEYVNRKRLKHLNYFRNKLNCFRSLCGTLRAMKKLKKKLMKNIDLFRNEISFYGNNRIVWDNDAAQIIQV